MRLPYMLAAVLLLAAVAHPQDAVPAAPIPLPKDSSPIMIHVFPNKITLIHRRTTANRIVAVVCLARPGAAVDPDAKVGRTHLMMRVLPKGTTSRSSDEIAQTLEGLGVRFATGEQYDYVSASFQCVRDDLSTTLDIYADVLRHPTFPLEEIRIEKQKVLSAIRSRDDQTPSATMKAFRRALYGPAPYGRPLEGEPETVPDLTQIDMVEAHREVFAPEYMTFAIVGDITKEEAIRMFEQRFGDMPVSNKPLASAFVSVAPRAGNEELVRDIEQGFISMGTPTCSVGHEDSVALDVAGAILGQGMSARMFRTLRDEQGLAYSVGAFNSRYQNSGFFCAYIGTSPEAVRTNLERRAQTGAGLEQGVTEMDWAARALWAEVDNLRSEPAEADEIDRAKSYLIGGYLRSHETNASQANYLAYWYTMGLGVEYDEKYPQAVRAVTARDVMRVANKYFVSPSTAITRPKRTAANIPSE